MNAPSIAILRLNEILRTNIKVPSIAIADLMIDIIRAFVVQNKTSEVFIGMKILSITMATTLHIKIMLVEK